MPKKTVSKVNPLAYIKAVLTTVGAIATGLAGLYGDEPALVITGIVVTALLTYLVPNWPTADEPDNG